MVRFVAKTDHILVEMRLSGLYMVNRLGQIWTCKSKTGHIYPDNEWRRAEHRTGKYFQVMHKRRYVYAHRFVYFWFHDRIDPEMEIDHINLNGLDNRPENLEMVSIRENMKRAGKAGLMSRKDNVQYLKNYWANISQEERSIHSDRISKLITTRWKDWRSTNGK